MHSWVDLLLRVEITTLLFADTWLKNTIVGPNSLHGAMSTRSGSVATIIFQNQVFI